MNELYGGYEDEQVFNTLYQKIIPFLQQREEKGRRVYAKSLHPMDTGIVALREELLDALVYLQALEMALDEIRQVLTDAGRPDLANLILTLLRK